ncbi:SRPBCC domain-containing protein [Sphaerisporangium sp. NPDC088356]|uniref:SRPBCC family protein n=1 Tax=Sphaerisporangium sp. NPDC088356 TaxID=3154871 RepID=UPI00344AB6EA
MSVINLAEDFENLSLTLVSDFRAPARRVWQLWADPRQLERWWGPPSHPAKVEEHNLTPGGKVTYVLTGRDGDMYRGWWNVTAVHAPTSLEFTDGFADEHGRPVAHLPMTKMHMRLIDHHGGTRMELRASFDSREQMDHLVAMGLMDGLPLAVGQLDVLLAV